MTGQATPIPTPPATVPPPPGNTAAALTLAGMKADILEAHEEALASLLTGNSEETEGFIASMDHFDTGAATFAGEADLTRPDHSQEYAGLQAILMMKDAYQMSVNDILDISRSGGTVDRESLKNMEDQFDDLSNEMDWFYRDYSSRVAADSGSAGDRAAVRLTDAKNAMLAGSGDLYGYLLTGDSGKKQDFIISPGEIDDALAVPGPDLITASGADQVSLDELRGGIAAFESTGNALAESYEREGSVNRTGLDQFGTAVDRLNTMFDGLIRSVR
ncbi:hypothetical protein J2741_000114 [Methanolinea mesophila]|uniref:hypothetical protein n=1 Tax=Methanolinea mesophila TaxID=547055 RepID=UPI001AE89DDE|nr:hypothetical protein [Methanolinea mesophila]MBP1927567.1 hypothetical protein [Methanolinea mesophila]